jgi:hypothetical protein
MGKKKSKKDPNFVLTTLARTVGEGNFDSITGLGG